MMAAVTAGAGQVASVVALLNQVAKLKDTPRTGWVENGIPTAESVADHMYRMSLLCLMCPDTSLNRDHMVRMALCHDVAESIVGDISPQMNIPKDEKFAKEKSAMEHLSHLAAHGGCPSFATEMQQLWSEFEAQETKESHFVKDMDLLEMVLQAHYYEQQYPDKDLGRFFVSGEKIQHPWAREIYNHLRVTRAHPPPSA